MKANMEYLKDMIKHELGKNVSMPDMGGSGVSPATSMSMPQGMGKGKINFLGSLVLLLEWVNSRYNDYRKT